MLCYVVARVPLCCAGQAEDVFSFMAGDFMRPVVDVVDQLLTAGVNVTVYNGQLDLIVDTLGTCCHLFSRNGAHESKPIKKCQDSQKMYVNLCLFIQVRSCGLNG